MKKILSLCISVLIVFIFLGVMPVHGEAEIYDNVIRLHVIANSNSEEDQQLKLFVRDEILAEVNKICCDCSTVAEAREKIENNINNLKDKALHCIYNRGYRYPVSVIIDNENYPTKNYESLAFPAGNYLSLQVKIGDATGENWWCVLFPPLCLSTATKSDVSSECYLENIGLSQNQYKIITESDNATYNVRFKILETVGKVFS